MAALFSPETWPFWAAALAIALFFPTRQLIWVLYVRRAQKAAEVDDAERARLRRRASVTAALICAIFSALYVSHLFAGPS